MCCIEHTKYPICRATLPQLSSRQSAFYLQRVKYPHKVHSKTKGLKSRTVRSNAMESAFICLSGATDPSLVARDLHTPLLAKVLQYPEMLAYRCSNTLLFQRHGHQPSLERPRFPAHKTCHIRDMRSVTPHQKARGKDFAKAYAVTRSLRGRDRSCEYEQCSPRSQSWRTTSKFMDTIWGTSHQ